MTSEVVSQLSLPVKGEYPLLELNILRVVGRLAGDENHFPESCLMSLEAGYQRAEPLSCDICGTLTSWWRTFARTRGSLLVRGGK